MKILILFLVAMVVLPVTAEAQGPVLKRHTFGSAGSHHSADPHALNTTIGQPVIGLSVNDSLAHNLGFWGWTYITTGVDDQTPAAFTFELRQNYPNPFNPVTVIPYSVGQGRPVNVSIRIYDVSGKLVRTLVNQKQPSGEYGPVWDGHNDRGQPVASGIYFYRLEAGEFVDTKKLVILK